MAKSMFYLTQLDERPNGYVVLSEANQWKPWLSRNIPAELYVDVRQRLISNLKHLLVGLELKTALIIPHQHGGPQARPVLFESYFQNLILEFGVAAFSVLEGLGSAHWLRQNGQDGSAVPHISRAQWSPALCAVYDDTGEHGLADAIGRWMSETNFTRISWAPAPTSTGIPYPTRRPSFPRAMLSVCCSAAKLTPCPRAPIFTLISADLH